MTLRNCSLNLLFLGRGLARYSPPHPHTPPLGSGARILAPLRTVSDPWALSLVRVAKTSSSSTLSPRASAAGRTRADEGGRGQAPRPRSTALVVGATSDEGTPGEVGAAPAMTGQVVEARVAQRQAWLDAANFNVPPPLPAGSRWDPRTPAWNCSEGSAALGAAGSRGDPADPKAVDPDGTGLPELQVRSRARRSGTDLSCSFRHRRASAVSQHNPSPRRGLGEDRGVGLSRDAG